MMLRILPPGGKTSFKTGTTMLEAAYMVIEMRYVGILAVAILCLTSTPAAGPAGSDWPSYGHDPGGQRFSPLDTINRANVASLRVAWTFRTGDAYQPPRGRPTAFESTPLYIDGVLYLTTSLGRVVALDPARSFLENFGPKTSVQ